MGTSDHLYQSCVSKDVHVCQESMHLLFETLVVFLDFLCVITTRYDSRAV